MGGIKKEKLRARENFLMSRRQARALTRSLG